MRVAAAKPASCAAVAMLIAGAVGGLPTEHPSAVRGNLTLTAYQGEALGGGAALMLGPMVMPVATAPYMANADAIFLQPLGFTGSDLIPVDVPASYTSQGMYDFDTIADRGSDNLIDAIQQQLATGDFSAADPLVIFGYSQGTAVASVAMEKLAQMDIDPALLHFVLVGDPASAFGGVLNSFLASLPESYHAFAMDLLTWFGLDKLMGTVTPDGPFATDVFTLPGDGWSDWPSSADSLQAWQALGGMFSTHLEYFGLTPDDIQGAELSHIDGMTTYYTLDSPDNPLEALWNAAMNIVFMPDEYEWLRF